MTTTANLQLLVVFCAVADQTSFSRAAAKLGVAKGTVSRSIAQLEDFLQLELVHRTTHQVSLSSAGAELYERAKEHILALQKAVLELPELDEEPSGILRISAPPSFGNVELPPLLAAFSQRHPSVRFDVQLTAKTVDIVKEGFDLSIRVALGPLKDSPLTMRRLVRHSSGFYAAPSYIARRGCTQSLGDKRHLWIMHSSAVRLHNVDPDSVTFILDDFNLARSLAAEGAGIVFLPSFMARPYVRTALLEEIRMPDVPVIQSDLVMLFPPGRQLSRKVSSFRDFLVTALRTSDPTPQEAVARTSNAPRLEPAPLMANASTLA